MDWFIAYYSVRVTNVIGIKEAILEAEEIFDRQDTILIAEEVTNEETDKEYTILFTIKFSADDFPDAAEKAEQFIETTEKHGARFEKITSIERAEESDL